MKFIHRLGYYLGGFSLGLVILAFFLSGKKTSCNYFPDARVLKSIRTKERDYSEEARRNMELYRLDSTDIAGILEKGDVDFSRSNTERDSCNLYLVTGQAKNYDLELLFENCRTRATLKELSVTQ